MLTVNRESNIPRSLPKSIKIIWLVLGLLWLPGCVASKKGRFVDLVTPEPSLLQGLENQARTFNASERAKAERALEEAQARQRQYADTELERNQRARELWARRLRLLERRRELAIAAREAFYAHQAPCRAILDLSVSDDRCQEMKRIEVLAQRRSGELSRLIEQAEARLGSNPPGASSRMSSEEAASSPANTPQPLPFFDRDLSERQVAHMLAPTPEELAVDADIAAARSERMAQDEPVRVEETQIDVSYGSIRIHRLRHAIEDGEPRRELMSTNVYRAFELDGMTRVLSEQPFDEEIIDLLAVEGSARRCLQEEDVLGLLLCKSRRLDSPVVQTGAINVADGSRSSTTPINPRTLVYGGTDPAMGGVLGFGLGIRAGYQLLRPHLGHGEFSRWKLAAMIGLQGDVLVDLSKDYDDQPRSVASLRPEIAIRFGRSAAFRLTPDASYETGDGVSLDLSAALTIDSFERRGASLSATLRPFIDTGGIYVRWDRYSKGQGDAWLGGVELSDELAPIPAVVAGVLGLSAAIVLIANGIYDCDANPDCRDGSSTF